jgi:hypothetical protein
MRLFVITMLLVGSVALKAQSTYVNVPAPSQPDKGQVTAQSDLNYYPVGTEGVFHPQVIYGVTENLEAAMGVENFSTNGQQMGLVSGLKYRVKYHWGKGYGLVYGGEKFYIPLHDMDGVGNYSYAMLRLPTPKVSASFGVYNQFNVNTTADTTGALLAFKVKTIYRGEKNYLYALGDWSSGSSGTGAVGVEGHPGTKWVFTPNYQMGNTGIKDGNHNFCLTVSYTFN